METLVIILARALILSFVLCCVFSGVIQVFAWSRHAREGVTVSLRALRHPEGYFDAIGQRQIGVARALLTVGGVAYLSYGVLLVVTTILK